MRIPAFAYFSAGLLSPIVRCVLAERPICTEPQGSSHLWPPPTTQPVSQKSNDVAVQNPGPVMPVAPSRQKRTRNPIDYHALANGDIDI